MCSLFSGCMMVAQLMSSTVQSLGCGAYLDSQAEACMCLKKDIKKQGSKSKRKTELWWFALSGLEE